MKKKFVKQLVASLLCTSIITSLVNPVNVKAEVKNVTISESDDLSILHPNLAFAAEYINELSAVKAIWDIENYQSADIFIRSDDELSFILLDSTTNKDYNIPIEMFHNYLDIRLEVYLTTGKTIVSDIITLENMGGLYDITKRDSDNDGICDGYEVWDVKSDPFNADSDYDGLEDGYEVIGLGTSPLVYNDNEDTDDDGLTNIEEMQKGTNPYLVDSDFDGCSDMFDPNPLKCDTNLDRTSSQANSDLELRCGEYDQVYKCMTADNQECCIVFNKITKGIKYIKIGDNYESFYNYNQHGKLTSEIHKVGSDKNITVYAYDDSDNMIFIGNPDINYQLDYNSDGKLVETKKGKKVIANYDYDNDNSYRIKFANNQTIKHEYDNNTELITVNNDKYYETTYDGDGNVLQEIDYKNDIQKNYSYNTENQLQSIDSSKGLSIDYTSNGENTVTKYILNGEERLQSINVEDDKITSSLVNGGKFVQQYSDNEHEISFTLTGKNDKFIENSTYISENNVISQMKNGKLDCQYTIDAAGNITSISKKIVYSYHIVMTARIG